MKDKNSVGCDDYLSVAECQEFATNHYSWGGTESADADWPTGCYLYKDGKVWFNPIWYEGKGEEDSQQVCEKTGDNIFFIFKTKSRYPSECLCHNSTLTGIMMPR